MPRTIHYLLRRRVGVALLSLSGILIQFFAPSSLAAAKGDFRSPVRTEHFSEPLSGVPQAQTDSVRQIALSSSDIIYSPSTKMIYASVPSSAGSQGNSITAVDPATGMIGTSSFIGSEPNKLALSDDGKTLYAALDGAAAVRRFDIPSMSAGLQFPVGREDSGTKGIFYVNDLEVMPGNPDAVAISRKFIGRSPAFAGVAIYDNGTPRSSTTTPVNSGASLIEFSSTAATLYGYRTDGNFYKMAVDSTGVSQANTFNSGIQYSGDDLKFDNGLLYTEYGKVIDPEAQKIVGTYPGVVPNLGSNSLVEPDSKVGRTYFLTGSGANWTIRAFDQATFQELGSLQITGINGTPGSLTRWGANGLAFRTSGKQLFLIQTSLIPSAEPIPTPSPTPLPSPTPTPTTPDLFIRTVPLPAQDIILDPLTQNVYASVASSDGDRGNTLTQINPVSGEVGSSFFVGSEPGKIALADDGHTLYTILTGAAAVRRFDLATKTVGLQFPVGYDSTFGVLVGDDIAVLPGNPDAVAVSRRMTVGSPNNAGVAVYDNGTPRPNGNAGGSQLEFSNSAQTLYAKDLNSPVLQFINVDSAGVTFSDGIDGPGAGDLKFDNGLLYFSSGHVLDPVNRVLLGTFKANLDYHSIVLPDSANNRVYFLDNQGALLTLHVFDQHTFLEIGSVSLGFHGGAKNLIRWGDNGLAFSNGRELVLVQTSLVPSASVVPTPTPTPSPTPTPTPPVAAVRQIALASNDIVYSPSTKLIYASVPSSAGSQGNSITAVDPATGMIGTSSFIGSEPNKLALSDDGKTLYAGLDGAAAVRRFDIPSMSPGLQFTLGLDPFFGGAYRAGDIEVLPGHPETVAISRRCGCTPSYGGTAIYDNGIQRPTALPAHTGPNIIKFSSSPSILYGSANEGYSEFYRISVNNSGVSVISKTLNLIYGDFRADNGLVYSTGGVVANPDTLIRVGSFPFGNDSGGLVVSDSSVGRVYYLTNGTNGWTLRAFDQTTFRQVGALPIPYLSGSPSSLIRWGANGLAFRTTGGQLYFIQTALIPSSATIPTYFQFSAPTYGASEAGTGASITVTRTGDISAASTVDYSISDGTAVADQDYTAVNGTLSFAPGERSKNFTVPITNDNIFEGNETVNLKLSNPTGGAEIVYPSAASLNIIDNDQMPRVRIDDVSIEEPAAGTSTATFTVSLTNPTVQVVTVDYATADGSAQGGSDYVATSGTLTFNPLETSKTVAVTINSDGIVEPTEYFFVNLLQTNNNAFIFDGQGKGTIADSPSASYFGFSAPTYTADEGTGSASITVTRSGDTSKEVSVDYSTVNTTYVPCAVVSGQAAQNCDFLLASGTLSFKAGETSKTFSVIVIDDSRVEGNETLQLALSNPSAGAIIGPGSTATLTINDNDTAESQTTNPVDDKQFFVKQQYFDFLSRMPDDGGFNYWTGQLGQCGTDAQCMHDRRVGVSDAFFFEPEFQESGAYVYRIYKAAFGAVPTYAEFMPDRSRVIGGTELDASKTAFATGFVQRDKFLAAYPRTMSADQFVSALLKEVKDTSGVDLSQQQNGLIALYDGTDGGRARILRQVADNQGFIDAEYRRSFVLMEYFAYLRRDPDTGGFDFWMGQMNRYPVRDVNIQWAMVCSFITSPEYQLRFGSAVTHTNQECPQ